VRTGALGLSSGSESFGRCSCAVELRGGVRIAINDHKFGDYYPAALACSLQHLILPAKQPSGSLFSSSSKSRFAVCILFIQTKDSTGVLTQLLDFRFADVHTRLPEGGGLLRVHAGPQIGLL